MADKKHPGDVIKDRFPKVTSVSWLIYVGLLFIAAGGAAQLFDNSKQWELFFRVLVYVGVILIIFWIVVLLFEALSFLASPFRFFLRLLLLIPKFIARIYIITIKILIKPAVIEIINSKPHIGTKFTLRKQIHDDDYWDQTLDFNKIHKAIFTIQPEGKNDYWRFGFKFSKDGIFPSVRHAENYPLFHLTKELGSQTLIATYYNEKIQKNDRNAIDNYKNDLFSIVFDKKDSFLRIRVLNKTSSVVFSEKYSFDWHSHAQVLAWGDGHDFSIDVAYSKE